MAVSIRNQLETINRFRERAPVDVEGIIDAIGLDYVEANLHPNISGMIEMWGDTYRIAVNRLDPKTRQRFTAAHELGHYMLHRDRIGDGVDDDRIYRSTAEGKYYNTAIGRRQETEANQFAANLLMPLGLVRELGQEVVDLGEMDSYETQEGVEYLASRFGVSRHAMSIRLGVPYE